MNDEYIMLGERKNEFIIRPGAMDDIKKLELEIKKLKKLQDGYKTKLLNEMEEKGIFKISNEEKGISISYVEPKTNEEVFHKDEFREKYPDIYDEFVTLDGKKKAYLVVRITNE